MVLVYLFSDWACSFSFNFFAALIINLLNAGFFTMSWIENLDFLGTSAALDSVLVLDLLYFDGCSLVPVADAIA